MPARGEPRGDHLGAAGEMHEPHVVARLRDAIAITLLERGAREDHVARPRVRGTHDVDDAIEPRRAIVVGQRNARAHLLDVGGRMQVVRIDQRPAEPRGERGPDGRLAAAGNAHQHDDHRSSCVLASAWPPNALRIIASIRSA
jgi:hypothetical protein